MTLLNPLIKFINFINACLHSNNFFQLILCFVGKIIWVFEYYFV